MEIKERESNFELLRIISIILIICFHIAWHTSAKLPSNRTVKYIIDFIYMFGELGVNVFIIISGYFNVTKEFSWNKFHKLILQVAFYLSILCGIYIYKNNFNIIDLLVFICNSLKEWWFISLYIIIYLLTPFINTLLNNLEQDKYKKLTNILLLLYCIIPTICSLLLNTSETLIYYSRFNWLIVLYIYGAYIRLHKSDLFKNLKNSLVNLLTSILIAISFIIILNKISVGLNSFLFWQPNSLIMFYMSISLFMVFKYMKIKKNKMINIIASTTLGIYLLHDNIYRNKIWNFFGTKEILENFNKYYWKYILLVILVFFTCVLIELLRQKIFDITTHNIKKMKKE